MICDFCKKNGLGSFVDRPHIIIDGFMVTRPTKSFHDYHLLIFNTNRHRAHIHQYSKKDTSTLTAILRIIDDVFADALSDYQGYNLMSNNGTVFAGQKIPHAHIHLFMRYTSESMSPYVRMNTGDFVNDKETEMLKIPLADVLNQIKETYETTYHIQ